MLKRFLIVYLCLFALFAFAAGIEAWLHPADRARLPVNLLIFAAVTGAPSAFLWYARKAKNYRLVLYFVLAAGWAVLAIYDVHRGHHGLGAFTALLSLSYGVMAWIELVRSPNEPGTG
jgi:hypothetical protein